jgi:hypothetical protein
VTAHNNTTHGVDVDRASALSYFDTVLNRWIGPRTSGTTDVIETNVGFTMITEINSSLHALQQVIPIAGHTTYGYDHPLVKLIEYKGRWLQAINIATGYFLNEDNNTTFNVGNTSWWSSYRSTECPSTANTTIICPGCYSP